MRAKVLLLVLLALAHLAPVITTRPPNRLDFDGNGKYDEALLWDADGDGSQCRACTGINAPYPQCKHASETVCPDLADDLVCAVNGCGFGQMDFHGTIRLQPAVYALLPCWDVGEWEDDDDTPGAVPSVSTINDPRDETRREDSTTNATVWASCPDDDEGNTVFTAALANWGGVIEGAGMDLETQDQAAITARGYGRVNGTYIADDRGRHSSDWFDTGNFTRGINIGMGLFNPSEKCDHTGKCADDASAGSKGVWTTSGLCPAGDCGGGGATTQDVFLHTRPVAHRSKLCLNNSGADVQDLVEGDTLIVQASTVDPSIANKAHLQMRVLSVAGSDGDGTEDSCPTTYREVSFGGAPGQSTFEESAIEIYGAKTIAAGSQAVHPRPDYFTGGARIRNLTIAPQDFYNEGSGECSETGTWDTTQDAASADDDCDTNPLFGFWGPGSPRMLEDIAVLHWHHFAIDGDVFVARDRASHTNRLVFRYGGGTSIGDPGWHWSMRDTTVLDSAFHNNVNGDECGGAVIASFGGARDFDGMLLRNVCATQIAAQNSEQRWDRWSRIRMEGTAMTRAFAMTCGVEHVTMQHVYSSGRRRSGSGGAMKGLFLLECGDATGTDGPITGNLLYDIMEDPPGSSQGEGEDEISLVEFNVNPGDSDTIADVQGRIFGNSIIGARLAQGVSATQDALFTSDDDGAGNGGADTPLAASIFEVNNFVGASIRQGALFAIGRFGGYTADLPGSAIPNCAGCTEAGQPYAHTNISQRVQANDGSWTPGDCVDWLGGLNRTCASDARSFWIVPASGRLDDIVLSLRGAAVAATKSCDLTVEAGAPGSDTATFTSAEVNYGGTSGGLNACASNCLGAEGDLVTLDLERTAVSAGDWVQVRLSDDSENDCDDAGGSCDCDAGVAFSGTLSLTVRQ